ncbi:unnamed protein product [Adineta ricciae]|uniref:PARP catalytic domain-containing protein n=1 Tax=Adineta ricciae TaxID=249248 RepID=A0A816CEB5_ADIRI|nr:unnamed protein product [Adineta ricciae]CAF1623579.1 unnamed protein product [Adineta ricciae]
MPDIEYDGFEFYSSQDPFELEYVIEQFEFRRCWKSKTKGRKSSFSISSKTARSQSISIKFHSVNCTKKPSGNKTRNQKSRIRNSNRFGCDQQLQAKTKSNSTTLTEESKQTFSIFRRRFYQKYRDAIKASLKNNSDIKITDIRLAHVNKSVQDDFMKTLAKQSSHHPQLVYHGTKSNNIEGILQYGFLIPEVPHPTNADAPIIQMINGAVHGTGVYCSYTADYSLYYSDDINTLLACAAIPHQHTNGRIHRRHGNILVLSNVSQIVPLFLVDFEFQNRSQMNYPYFKQHQLDEHDERKRRTVCLRKYFQKILNYLNDQSRSQSRYQLRIVDFHE